MLFHKSLIAAATLIALSPVVHAEVKTDGLLEIYGRASFSIDQLDDGDKYSRMNLSSNASRLGFRGSKKIGELTGIWQIEQEVQINLGNTKDDTNNRLASRDTFRACGEVSVPCEWASSTPRSKWHANPSTCSATSSATCAT